MIFASTVASRIEGATEDHQLFRFDPFPGVMNSASNPANIFSADEVRAEALAIQIDAGMVFVNRPAWTAPNVPFGGVKHSGYGRELSEVGIQEFVNKKLIEVNNLYGLAASSLGQRGRSDDVAGATPANGTRRGMSSNSPKNGNVRLSDVHRAIIPTYAHRRDTFPLTS